MNTTKPIAKLLPVKFENYIAKFASGYTPREVAEDSVIEVFDVNQIKDQIKSVLFSNNKPNYVLVGYDNRVFVCSPQNAEKHEFSRHDIENHPMKDLVL